MIYEDRALASAVNSSKFLEKLPPHTKLLDEKTSISHVMDHHRDGIFLNSNHGKNQIMEILEKAEEALRNKILRIPLNAKTSNYEGRIK